MMTRKSKRMAYGASCCALAVALVGGFEGKRNVSYLDVVGVATACFGETRGIKLGMKFTDDQCNTMLVSGLDDFAAGIEKCVPELTDKDKTSDRRYVAHLSLAYNIGVGAYCKSSVARLANAGKPLAACDYFMKWNRAGGMVWKGLTNRRAKEREYCLSVVPTYRGGT